MHVDVAPHFNQLRKDTFALSGVDFLKQCADVMRAANFHSSKSGVANRSWHKTGRAFDYDQTSGALVIVGEEISGKQFFRTYLICKDQEGGQGTRMSLHDIRGFNVTRYVLDLTELAAKNGFHRIPAWKGWQSPKNYNLREFWHYQKDDGFTWDQAMQQIKDHADIPSQKKAVAAGDKIIGLNDRDSNTGDRVTLIQKALNSRGLLPSKEIDGIYGRHTLAAVEALQRAAKLGVDGTVGPLTAASLGIVL